MELLSPAGNRESFIAAIQAGADAVYIGGKAFSARQSAANFDGNELSWAVDYAHERGKKVYVTVNTLINQAEWSQAVEYIHELAELSVDALIMQDLGLIAYAAKRLPTPLHASTQATVTNTQGAVFFKSMGVSRVILARETNISEIAEISMTGGIDVEVFIHGALCVSVSGQCLFSSIVGGRSGNRGRCAQPCRLPYKLLRQGGDEIARGNLLSPRDLMTIDHLCEFRKAGVTSLKIEGRLKSTAYVALVTEAYRKALDELVIKCYADSGVDVSDTSDSHDIADRLRLLGNRDGFTQGYAFREDDKFEISLMSKTLPGYTRTKDEREIVNTLTDRAIAIKNGESVNVLLEAHAELFIGNPCVLTLNDKEKNLTVTVKGAVVQPAKSKALSAGEAKRQFSKTGGTIYTLSPLTIEMDDGAFVAVSELNKLRRDAVEKMRSLRINTARTNSPIVCRAEPHAMPDERKHNSKPSLIVQTADLSQIEGLFDAGADHIYWTPDDFRSDTIKKNMLIFLRFFQKISLMLPNYLTTRELESIPHHGSIIAANAGQLTLSGVSATDYTQNIFNAAALEYLFELGIKRVTLSPELTLSQAFDIRKLCLFERGVRELEIIAYGHIPLMTLRHCPMRANVAVKCGQSGVDCGVLTDRLGVRFPLRRYFTDEGCTVRVLNALPLSIHKKPGAFEGLADAWRLMFYTESENEAREITGYYRSIIDHKKTALPDILSMPTTSGHWFRGV